MNNCKRCESSIDVSGDYCLCCHEDLGHDIRGLDVDDEEEFDVSSDISYHVYNIASAIDFMKQSGFYLQAFEMELALHNVERGLR